MTQFTDIMHDFETLGTVPHAVVLQLGWALFDAQGDREDMVTGNVIFSIPEQVAVRRFLCPNTWRWWLTQDPQLFRKLISGKTGIREGLTTFTTAVLNHCGPKPNLWGNGANFDEPILDNLYRTNGMEGQKPWKYSNSRCVRTIKALCPKVPKVIPELKHDGESDSIAQAKFVRNCYKELNSKIKVGVQPYVGPGSKETAADILARDGS